MIIIGVDPGLTTGLVRLETVDVRISAAKKRAAYRVTAYAQLEFEAATEWLLECGQRADLIAVERFLITHRTITGSREGANATLDMIGYTRFFAYCENLERTLQLASDAKTAFNDDVLRSINVYNQVTGTHARDALRHALLAHRRQTDRRRRT